MIGAIVGDIVGSRFEWDNLKSKEFKLFTNKCSFTDDSVMTLAVCEALMRSQVMSGKTETEISACSKADSLKALEKLAVQCMQEVGRPYPSCGYGGHFQMWMYSDSPEPYNSFGNGAAMRVSGCGYAANSVEEAVALSDAVTKVTHNHPEGLKGARATAVAVYLARTGMNMSGIHNYIVENYYPLDFTLDEIRPSYYFDVTCQGSVPQALQAFFESTSFEDAIRNAISVGGDSDTIAAITGAVAEAYYGVSDEIREAAEAFLDDRLLSILRQFEKMW